MNDLRLAKGALASFSASCPPARLLLLGLGLGHWQHHVSAALVTICHPQHFLAAAAVAIRAPVASP